MKKRVYTLLSAALTIAAACGSLTAYANTTVDTDEFSFTYSDLWNFDSEKDLSTYSTSVKATPWVAKEDDATKKDVYVTIAVNKNSRPSYDSEMHSAGFDTQEEVLHHTYDKVNIGGIDFVEYATSYSTKYMAYDDEKNAYISIYVGAKADDERIPELLESIKFNVQEYSDKNTPWYWEGTPYETADHTVTIGDYAVSAKQLKIVPSEPSYDTFGSRIMAKGSDVYVLADGVLKKYTREGDTLINPETVDMPVKAKEMYTDKNGIMYFSNSYTDLTAVADGTSMVIAPKLNYVAVHPSGAMGISWTSKPDVQIVNMETGEVTDKTFPGFSSVSSLFVTQNYVMLSGRNDTSDGSHLVIFNMNGDPVAELNKENTTTGYYGHVSAVAETTAGLFIVDGNMRDVYFTDPSGNLITSIDMKELLGTGYPWPSCAVSTADGKILLVLTDDRQDDSCKETVVFEISGFGQAVGFENASETAAAQPQDAAVTTAETEEALDIDFSSAQVVKAVQDALNQAGFDCGTADGIAGKKTYAALKAFQEAHGLTVTESINAETYKALGLS